METNKLSMSEVEELTELAEKNYEMLKDRVHEQYFELERYKNIIDELKKENEKLHKQVVEYQDEIFARDNNWYDMCD